MEEPLCMLRLCSPARIREAVSSCLALKSTHPPGPPHPQTYGLLFNACARHRLLAEGQALHCHMLSSPNHKPDLFVSNHLVNMYAKCGRLELAHHLFDEMPHRNVVSWTTLLTGYGQQGRHEDCFRLFSAMLPHYLPNEFTLGSILSSCAGSRHGCRGRQVHALAFKTSFDAHVYVGNALITMYFSCFGDDGKHSSDGWSIFRTMSHRNLISWNSIIAGFQIYGELDRSLSLFSCMRRDSVGFDSATLVSVAFSCTSLDLCRQLHSLVIKNSLATEVKVATALVKAYSTLGGEVDDCFRVFSEAGECDIVSWTGIITSCAEQDPEEAIILFCRLRWEGFEPDRYTFSIVVKACSGLASVRHGSAIHSLILRFGFENDVVLCNALIHAYARCGSLALSERVFAEMVVRDIVSWNSMIKAYANYGCGKEAMQLFSVMSVPPDSSTFTGLLSACSHGGLVDEGRRLFHAMSVAYGVVPQLDHFACMVDILGRAGHLVEAEELICRMPLEPDFVVWSALLGACRKHENVKVGERAAKKLIELEPGHSAGYVLMSNIYVAGGSLGDAGFLRKGMKELGLKKEIGLSWIEVGNCVHKFSVGGRSHPQREAIYAKLRCLVDELKIIGYAVQTKSVLHEIEEVHKEEQLLHHSEKLALAFGLMNASSNQASVTIMKNIRICLDCHNFMKFASKSVRKEIMVRDTIRFHHFKDGECSCDDYW